MWKNSKDVARRLRGTERRAERPHFAERSDWTISPETYHRSDAWSEIDTCDGYSMISSNN